MQNFFECHCRFFFVVCVLFLVLSGFFFFLVLGGFCFVFALVIPVMLFLGFLLGALKWSNSCKKSNLKSAGTSHADTFLQGKAVSAGWII